MVVNHTSMNSSRWFVTTRTHPGELQMHAQIVSELESLYRKARIFPKASFSEIYFAVGYFVGVAEKIKLGRIRKSENNTLWVELIVDGNKWENLTTAELKDELMLMMTRAIVMAGRRYKLSTAPFEEKIRELESKRRAKS